MSVNATMAVLYAQTGLGTSLANAAVVTPQTSATMSRVLAAEMARHEQQQVTKSEPGSQTALSPDARHNGSAPQFGNRRKKRAPFPAAEDLPAGESASPLVGNLLNIRV